MIIPFTKADPEMDLRDAEFVPMSEADGSVQALCES